jgi:hypothetical protein
MNDDERAAYYANGIAQLKRDHGPRPFNRLRRVPRCRCGQREPCPELIRGLAYFGGLS